MTGERKVKEVVYTIKGGGDSEISRTVRTERAPVSFERLKFLCYFVAGIVAEVLGFGLALVIVLCLAGVLR